MFFRKRRTKGDPGDTRYLVLDGEWTSEIYNRAPIRVPAVLDVGSFLAQRPMPSVRPDDAAFNSWVGGDDELMRRLWVTVLLHHLDPAVRAQCLRSPHIEGFAHADPVADLLIDPQVSDAAADAVWRMDDDSVRVVLNIVLSRGIVPSGFSPEQTSRALELLRSACPRHRQEFLEMEAPDHERTAARLAELVAAEIRRYDSLGPEQRERCHDLKYLDELALGGATAPEWLAGLVEIRTIGHRLDRAGGLPLMQAVARRAGELSDQRMAEIHLDRWYWDRIGDWRS